MGEAGSRDKEFIDYSMFDVYMGQLVELIGRSDVVKDLKYIVGIPRGGLPIAVHLSHYLKIDLENPNFLSRDEYEHTLIVDDIAHTGDTLQHYKSLGFIYSATLFYKESSLIEPTFYVKEATKWIVFPWEKEDEVPNRPE